MGLVLFQSGSLTEKRFRSARASVPGPSVQDLKGSDSEGEKGADDSLAKLGGLEAHLHCSRSIRTWLD